METEKYEVTVGNIGSVTLTDNEDEAYKDFSTYLEQSKHGRGRASGESVTLWEDGEPILEHRGRASKGN